MAVQGLTKKPSNIELAHRSGSPFSAKIQAAQPPLKYKTPKLPTYIGKEEPVWHIGKFEDQMELLGVEHDYRWRVFPTTLSDSAQEWYWKFKPGSITSWEQFRKEFCKVFSANQLADIKQGKDESLKDYIQRFMREANRASIVGDEGKFIAISVGIIYLSPLWDTIHRSCWRWEIVNDVRSGNSKVSKKITR